MTKLRQDTQTVHLLGEDGQPLCSVEHVRGVPPMGIRSTEWAAGFTPGTLGTRICRDCEEKAGTATHFEPGEREAEDLPSTVDSRPHVGQSAEQTALAALGFIRNIATAKAASSGDEYGLTADRIIELAGLFLKEQGL